MWKEKINWRKPLFNLKSCYNFIGCSFKLKLLLQLLEQSFLTVCFAFCNCTKYHFGPNSFTKLHLSSNASTISQVFFEALFYLMSITWGRTLILVKLKKKIHKWTNQEQKNIVWATKVLKFNIRWAHEKQWTWNLNSMIGNEFIMTIHKCFSPIILYPQQSNTSYCPTFYL